MDTNLLLNYFEVSNEGIIGREAEMRSSCFFFCGVEGGGGGLGVGERRSQSTPVFFDNIYNFYKFTNYFT